MVCAALPFASLGTEANYHTKALETFADQVSFNARLYNRSLFGYIHAYNRLPERFIDATSVSAFQCSLTHFAKEEAKRDANSRWRMAFKDSMEIQLMFYNHIRLD